ncbi:MAG: cyclic-di-AMP receptor [Candidatus Andersenbacteria bacterium]
MALLAIAIVDHTREGAVRKRLVAQEFVFTRLGSSGGFLRKRSATLLIGLPNEKRLADLKKILGSAGKERSALVSGTDISSLGQETGQVDVPVGAARLTLGGTTLFVVRLQELERY